MSRGLEATRSRRMALQARCAAQRDALTLEHRALEEGLRPVDRAIELARAFGPLAAVAGIVALIVAGPRRALRATQGVLTLSMFAAQAVRLLR